MKNCMFLGTSILNAFWRGLGRLLGGQNHQFSHFFRHVFDAKFGVQFGRAKNRKKCSKKKFFLIFAVVRRSVRPWGEGKRMGGRQLGRHLGMNPWPEILAMFLRNAFLELGPCIRHARHPFGRRRMCCARTAALQGGREMPMCMPCWAPCSNSSIVFENRRENCPQSSPKPSQEAPETHQNRPRRHP